MRAFIHYKKRLISHLFVKSHTYIHVLSPFAANSTYPQFYHDLITMRGAMLTHLGRTHEITLNTTTQFLPGKFLWLRNNKQFARFRSFETYVITHHTSIYFHVYFTLFQFLLVVIIIYKNLIAYKTWFSCIVFETKFCLLRFQFSNWLREVGVRTAKKNNRFISQRKTFSTTVLCLETMPTTKVAVSLA